MKLAVTYAGGEIFQHFGKTEEFKIYEIEDNKVVSSTVIGNEGLGHESLAGLLAEQKVEKLICGGLGQGALNALSASGIEVISGAEGDADAAVFAYLNGELESRGVNCDHHHEEGGEHHCGHHDHEGGEHHCGHHEEGEEHHCGHHDHEDGEHHCGHHEEGGCGSNDSEDEEGCGGCGSEGGCGGCGGCGGPRPVIFEGPNAGKKVSVNYKGTLDDGTQFDSSYDRGQTLDFICGTGMMIAGFDKAVVEMEVGQTVNVHLEPEEAYGLRDAANIFTINIAELPGSEKLNVGQQVFLQDEMGRAFPVIVKDKDDQTITLDANHELAGKALNFEIELVSVED
ncbi:MAG: FKBP-type peptidyl-prolyl cis-trans isomerase [Butyrivibrio sp.]|uniref:FKBP-type peptidyl-prolyl cis-trans isomerase n=1 Tax=Butyrivibrio sp. TaxID=28121 RepID=UPI0025CCAB05|nr:FKBP-type peptidyl-prolyl cis-trans isomerase [Butyrivibrio sp.]MCR5770455.1 FKBP-type peptidyl-prolyl cis-trans isomerase [Butyrivibrio sp.]